MTFITFKFKKAILPIIFILFTLSLLIFSNSNILAVRNSLHLWAVNVIPSLFPFFVATNLLMHTPIISYFELLFKNIMKPIFNVNGKCAFAFIMGIISGYPIGAKIACELQKNNLCTKIEAERLLSFTNNSGPLFIIGTVGISMFGSSLIGILLLITHFFSSITVGIIFRFWKKSSSSNSILIKYNNSSTNEIISFSNLGEIISDSIKSATSTIFMIGGFIVIFACIISIFNSSGILNLLTICITPLFNFLHVDSSFISPIITGLLEITNGINLISKVQIKAISINLIITSFLLGCGGICVFLQVFSIVSKSDLSIKPYIYGKILHGIISAFYTFLFIQIFPFFNLNL